MAVLFFVFVVLVSASVGAVLADEAQRYIVGFHSESNHLNCGSSVTALSAQLEAQGASVDHRYASINAISATLSDENLAELSLDPNVAYIVRDGIVGTPEWWSAKGDNPNSAPSADGVKSQATPVEFYPWGLQRINVPAMHRTDPRDLAAGIGLLSLGAVLGGVLLKRRRGLRWPNNIKCVSAVVVLSGLLFASGCTAVSVFPHVGIMGDGVTVALLDTGVELDHPDLEANILGGIDFVNGDNIPFDDNGHGTGVAGVALALENGSGVIGVAPAMKMWAVKTLRYDEQGTISDVIAGIEWAIERDVNIIGMSLGTDEDNRALREAVQAAERAGILLVAAAGNNGEEVLYPAAYPEVIAVGSTNESDQLAWFSNQGSELELVAPGTSILTTWIGKSYSQRDGTSFSVPHVIGVGALLFSAGVRDHREVRSRMITTAENLGLMVTAQGYGMVNAARAVTGNASP